MNLELLVLMMMTIRPFCSANEMKPVRKRLNGQHLRVIVSNIPPSGSFVLNSTGHFVGYSGPIFDVFHYVVRSLNFTYTFYPIGIEVGKKINGSWTGNLGQLKRKEYDLALGPYAMALDRFEVIEFVGYIGGSYTRLLLKYPEPHVSNMAVVQPYTGKAWLMWVGSMLALGLFSLGYVYLRQRRLLDKRTRLRAADDMMMYQFGTMTAQGGFYRSGHRVMGLLALTWCFAAFFFVNIYNSNLISFLSAQFQRPEVRNLDELAARDDYEIATFRGSVWENSLVNPVTEQQKTLGKRYKKCSKCSVPSLPELAQRPLEGKYVAYMAQSFASGMANRDYQQSGKKCRLTLGAEYYDFFYSFFGVPRTSPYIEEFHRETLWAKAFGIHTIGTTFPAPDYVFPRKCILKYNSKQEAVQSSNMPLKLVQFLPAFYLVAVGYSLAFLAFLVEKIIHFHRHR